MSSFSGRWKTSLIFVSICSSNSLYINVISLWTLARSNLEIPLVVPCTNWFLTVHSSNPNFQLRLMTFVVQPFLPPGLSSCILARSFHTFDIQPNHTWFHPISSWHSYACLSSTGHSMRVRSEGVSLPFSVPSPARKIAWKSGGVSAEMSSINFSHELSLIAVRLSLLHEKRWSLVSTCPQSVHLSIGDLFSLYLLLFVADHPWIVSRIVTEVVSDGWRIWKIVLEIVTIVGWFTIWGR